MAEDEFSNRKAGAQSEKASAIKSTEISTLININNISGPLVVFFGPRDIGKTVALLRLCTYLNKYDITVDEGFRSDVNAYKSTVDAFNKLRSDTTFAPKA